MRTWRGVALAAVLIAITVIHVLLKKICPGVNPGEVLLSGVVVGTIACLVVIIQVSDSTIEGSAAWFIDQVRSPRVWHVAGGLILIGSLVYVVEVGFMIRSGYRGLPLVLINLVLLYLLALVADSPGEVLGTLVSMRRATRKRWEGLLAVKHRWASDPEIRLDAVLKWPLYRQLWGDVLVCLLLITVYLVIAIIVVVPALIFVIAFALVSLVKKIRDDQSVILERVVRCALWLLLHLRLGVWMFLRAIHVDPRLTIAVYALLGLLIGLLAFGINSWIGPLPKLLLVAGTSILGVLVGHLLGTKVIAPRVLRV